MDWVCVCDRKDKEHREISGSTRETRKRIVDRNVTLKWISKKEVVRWMELGQDCVQSGLGISSVEPAVSTVYVLLYCWVQCVLPPLLVIYCLVVPGDRAQVQ
jgi:hypothetical protein